MIQPAEALTQADIFIRRSLGAGGLLTPITPQKPQFQQFAPPSL